MKLPDLSTNISNIKITKQMLAQWFRIILRWLIYVLVILAALVLFIWFFFGRKPLVEPDQIRWGVTYSPLASEGFELNSDDVFEAIISDLKPDSVRLVAYWNRIEKNPGIYDFSDLEKQVKLASDAQIPIVISVGRRVPRYPECHAPEWLDSLPKAEQNSKTLQFIQATIEKFDNTPHLSMWQIENEPFLGSFGICPPLDEDFLKTEIKLARTLTDKRIMTTESGELSVWLKASKYPDVLGTTLYRRVIVQGTNLAVNHIYPPWYYRARSNIVRMIRGSLDSVIVAELQAEPWSNVPIKDASADSLTRTMNPGIFEDNISFSESVGFPEVYFWGVEWWYYEMLNGNDYYWQRAQELFGN